MQTLLVSNKSRFRLGFLAGLIAGAIASALMILLSITTGGTSLPAALGSAIALAMPLPIFNFLHQLIGGDAKYYLFYIVLVGQCIVFAFCGGLCSLLVRPGANWKFSHLRDEQGLLRWYLGPVLALVLWLLTGLLFLPLIGGGLFGASLVTGTLNTMLSLAVVGLIFGLLFIFIHNWLELRLIRQGERSPGEQARIDEETDKRNLLLRRGLIVLGLGVIGWAAWRFIAGAITGNISQDAESSLISHYKSKVPAPAPNYGMIERIPNLSPAITPNDQFYVVSKNFVSDPTVDGATWQLQVNGDVLHPYTLSYDEVLALPRKGQYESLMCVSNDVGGPYMSNAYWEGIPLRDLLERAGGVKPGSTKVVFYSADDYSDSIHLAKALEPTTMMAVRMNGETLPQGHGFPARMLVPGIYGMKHAKWLTHIEVVNYDFQGYWQQSGWSDSANVRMTSRIDTPLQNATVAANKETYIAGVAFSGNKGISEVDVSFDSGQSWQRATLQRPFSDLTWVLWEIAWQPKVGIYTVLVRAIDLQGNVQDPHTAPPLPDGSSGYDSVTVKAS